MAVKSPVTQVDDLVKKLFVAGRLVQVNVRMWGMAYQLEDKDLKIDKVLPTIFQLGKKYLIDQSVRSQFKLIESRARSYLHKNSFLFPIAEAHFVPRRNLVKVINELMKFRDEYQLKVGHFIQNYERYKEENLAANPEYRDCLEPYYPDVATLREKFSFEISQFEISLPEKMKEVDLAQMAAEQEVSEEVRGRIERHMEEERDRAKNRMSGFVDECVSTLRTKVYEASLHVATKIANREVVTKTNLDTLNELADTFGGLNFFNDTEVAAQVARMKGLVSANHDFKTDREALTQLQGVLTSVCEKTKEVTDVNKLTGEFFRNIDV